jgi:fructose-bisphosphate aldolase, class II
MPIATPEIYAQMLDRAKEHGFAYPAINVTSSQTLNAALRGFADAESDGIVQVSTGGAEYLSGSGVKDMATGAITRSARSTARTSPSTWSSTADPVRLWRRSARRSATAWSR